MYYYSENIVLCSKGEVNPKISDAEIEKLYVQANHFALVSF